MYNMYNLLCLGLRFESHIPENIVDQMNCILVQNEILPHDESLWRVAEQIKNKAVSQAGSNAERKS